MKKGVILLALVAGILIPTAQAKCSDKASGCKTTSCPSSAVCTTAGCTSSASCATVSACRKGAACTTAAAATKKTTRRSSR